MNEMTFNWMKLRPLYLAISSIVILVGVVSFAKWAFALGVEFTGGTNVEYRLEKDIDSQEIAQKLKEKEIEVQSVQKSGDRSYILKLGNIDQEKQDTLK